MTERPSVLFLPGSGADPDFWKPVGERLPVDWSKSYLAWPGLGHNPPRPDVRGLADLVRLTEERIGDAPVHLVAQSLGGAVALVTALRNPTRVERLVLATSAAGLTVSQFGGHDWRPEYRLEYPNAAPWVYDAQVDLDDAFSAVRAPTLLLWGDDDPISPTAVGEYLQRRLPRATLRVIAGGTHALALERADEVAPLVEEHLSGRDVAPVPPRDP